MSASRRNIAGIALKTTGVLAIAYLVTLPFRGNSHDQDRVVALPILLRQVQGMGELHTSKFHYENVLEYATHREPTEWAKHVPIVADAVRTTTRNQALVSVTGEVSAGFDLSQAKITREAGRILVTVPAPQVYPARVQAKVHDASRGLFWRDHNIGLKAERDAEVRFRNASIAQGIEDHARAEVEKRLKSLLEPAVTEPVEVRVIS